jgi:hypothetical protein
MNCPDRERPHCSRVSDADKSERGMRIVGRGVERGGRVAEAIDRRRWVRGDIIDLWGEVIGPLGTEGLLREAAESSAESGIDGTAESGGHPSK